MKRLLIDLGLLALCATAIGGCLLYAAPAPFPRQRRPRVLCRTALVGQWRMRWGAWSGVATLNRDGSYEARAGDCRYVGSWSYVRGVLHITESCRPERADSWQHYPVVFDLATMRGRVDEPGLVFNV